MRRWIEERLIALWTTVNRLNAELAKIALRCCAPGCRRSRRSSPRASSPAPSMRLDFRRAETAGHHVQAWRFDHDTAIVADGPSGRLPVRPARSSRGEIRSPQTIVLITHDPKSSPSDGDASTRVGSGRCAGSTASLTPFAAAQSSNVFSSQFSLSRPALAQIAQGSENWTFAFPNAGQTAHGFTPSDVSEFRSMFRR